MKNKPNKETKMNQVEKIKTNPIVHAEQKVITTELLAQIYETEIDNIQKNFERNESRFIEGTHYYKLQGVELQEFKKVPDNESITSKFARQLILWTEKGASRHCKMLGTDMAWNRFDELEESYFSNKRTFSIDSYMIENPIARAKAWIQEQEEKKQLLLEQTINKPRVEFAKSIEGTSEKILIGDLAKLTDGKIGRNRLFKLMRKNKVLNRDNVPYQSFVDRGYFEVIERVINTVTKDLLTFTTYVTGRGQVWLINKINEWMEK